jgi:hypothetical protein
MKSSNALLKLAAVASSVVLLAGFVCYRAGAFRRLLQTDPPHADSLMGSSKSKVLIVPPSPDTPSDRPPAPSQEPASRATESKRTMMSGSKSSYVFSLQLEDTEMAPPPSKSQRVLDEDKDE